LIAWRLVIICYGRKDLEALGLAPRVGPRAVAPTKVVKDPQALKYGSSFTVKCSTQVAWALALRGQSEVNSNHVPTGIHISVPELHAVLFSSAVDTREDAMDGSSIRSPISVVAFLQLFFASVTHLAGVKLRDQSDASAMYQL
jgi:hypothetical protein